ncbi:MAG: hypothetical protein ACOCV4_06055 [Myxococcota bacterium]
MESLTQLSLSNRWGDGEDAFQALVTDMAAVEPRTIVQFGCGVSSVRLAQAFPEAQVLSLESDPGRITQVRALVSAYGMPPERLKIELRPLRFQWLGWGLYPTYAPGWFPDDIDAVVIDGPPPWTRRGREACLHQIAERVRIGGRVYLDDYSRPNERQTVSNWLRSYRSTFTVLDEIALDRHVCVIEKSSGVRVRPRFSLAVATDGLIANASLLADLGVRHVLGHPSRLQK